MGTQLPLELTDGLQIGGGFHVTHRAADFDDGNIRAAVLGSRTDAGLDFVGYMGNHLNGATLVIPTQFLFHDALVDFARGHAGFAPQVFINEALIVAQVQVGGNAVVGDKGFAVLKRAEQAGIYVVVGIALLHGNLVATGFQQTAQGGRGDPLTQGGDYAAGYENVLR